MLRWAASAPTGGRAAWPPRVRPDRWAVEPERVGEPSGPAVTVLLVVGARRKSWHRGLPLGRTVHGVLHRSACPVAVVPEWV